jgi:Ca-activated chloride channel family protein
VANWRLILRELILKIPMPDFLSNFHFIRPVALLLAPVAVVSWWLWQRRADPLRGWRQQIDPELLNALTTGNDSANRVPAMLVLTAWLLAVIAIAGPTWKLEPSPFADDATPLMILLKADTSMETSDIVPSRLERAHLKIKDLADARKGQPLGLIAYAGSAHLVLPPTPDTATVATMAAEVSPEIMPTPGDRLDLALRRASEILSKGGQGGTLLVIADSVDSDPATLSKATDFPVLFLAINTPDSSQDASLRAAASELGAKVESLTAPDDDITAIVRRAARTPVGKAGEQGAIWQEAGYWIVPLLALLFIANFRRESRPEEVTA